MSMERKLTEYMLDEIEGAEKYIKMAKHCKDQAMAMKFQEMAKEEMKHYDNLHNFLNKMIDDKSKEGENMEDIYKASYEGFENMYHDWADKVAYEISSFMFKK